MSADRLDSTRIVTIRHLKSRPDSPECHFARDLEILQRNVIEGVRNVGGSTRSNSDRHGPSYEKSTRLAESHFARD